MLSIEIYNRVETPIATTAAGITCAAGAAAVPARRCYTSAPLR